MEAVYGVRLVPIHILKAAGRTFLAAQNTCWRALIEPLVVTHRNHRVWLRPAPNATAETSGCITSLPHRRGVSNILGIRG